MKTHADLSGDGGSDILGQVVEQRRRVAQRLASVGAVVAVASGKGGVGKSTVTALLAEALAARGDRVGVVDADVNGPCVPRLLGVAGRRPRLTDEGLVPPETASGVAVMSSDLFLAGEDEPVRYAGPRDDAYTWRPTAEMTTVREFLSGTAWGKRDWLLLDLPPGAERLPSVLGIVPGLAGVLVVTIASPLALRVVGTSVTVAREHGVRLLGLVENMAARPCAACGEPAALFGEPGDVERAADQMGIPLVARIPFDAALADGSATGAVTPELTGLADRLAASVTEHR